MFKRLKKWLKNEPTAKTSSRPTPVNRSGAYAIASAKPAPVRRTTPARAKNEPPERAVIGDAGPGKNVLIRNKFVREDTGTHETLKILDESLIDSGEADGIDPYNTGRFDRSKNWNNRFRD